MKNFIIQEIWTESPNDQSKFIYEQHKFLKDDDALDARENLEMDVASITGNYFERNGKVYSQWSAMPRINLLSNIGKLITTLPLDVKPKASLAIVNAHFSLYKGIKEKKIHQQLNYYWLESRKYAMSRVTQQRERVIRTIYVNDKPFFQKYHSDELIQIYNKLNKD